MIAYKVPGRSWTFFCSFACADDIINLSQKAKKPNKQKGTAAWTLKAA